MNKDMVNMVWQTVKNVEDILKVAKKLKAGGDIALKNPITLNTLNVIAGTFSSAGELISLCLEELTEKVKNEDRDT